MRGSKVVAYRRDDSGNLRRAHAYVRYRDHSRSSDRVLAGTAMCRSVLNMRRDKAHNLLARVDVIEQKLARLQRFPQFWRDGDMRRLLSVWPTLRELVRQIGT
jgi:hypothetical protein